MATDRIFYLFEMQHKFVASIFADDQIKVELAEAGITRDMKGNLVASFAHPDSVENIRNASPAAQQVFTKAGGGLNRHDASSVDKLGNHVGYTNFFKKEVNNISRDYAHDLDARRLAYLDLFRFASNISEGKFIHLGEVLPIYGTSQTQLENIWHGANQSGIRLDPETISLGEKLALNTFSAGLDTTLVAAVDASEDVARREARLDFLHNFLDEAKAAGADIPNYEARKAELNSISSNLSDVKALSAAAVTVNYDVLKSFDAANLSQDSLIQRLSAELYLTFRGLSITIGFDEVLKKVDGIFEKAREFTAGFESTLSDFGETALGEMVKSMNHLLVGVGGNFVGDMAEFMNAVYEPIKKGFATGDWSELGELTAKYGAAIVFSAILVTVTVAGAAAIAEALVGPSAAAVAAALTATGWAAWGIYEGVTNGAELLGKIKTDLGKIIEIAGDRIEKGQKDLEALNAALMNVFKDAKAGNFDIPDFDGINNNVYVIDTGDLTLPDRIITDNPVAFPDGPLNVERCYGKNNEMNWAVVMAANDNRLTKRNEA